MIRTAILLAAGRGSRLRGVAPSKPLCPVAGRALIDHALHGLAQAGIARVVVVLGHRAQAIAEHLAQGRAPVAVETVRTDPDRPNGVSVLAAAPALAAGEDAVLAMADHLVVPEFYARLARIGAGRGATLGIDRRLDHPWIDPEDVTRVRTRDGGIVDIGKGLAGADCHDTGIFAIGPALFDALRPQADPSLSDGIRALARCGRAHTVDCSDLDWIDVDDPAALAQAEAWRSGSAPAPAIAPAAPNATPR